MKQLKKIVSDERVQSGNERKLHSYLIEKKRATEPLGSGFQNHRKALKIFGRKLKETSRKAGKHASNIGPAEATKNPKAIESTVPDVTNLNKQRKSLHLENYTLKNRELSY